VGLVDRVTLDLKVIQWAMRAALRYFNSSQYEKHPKSRKQALKHLLDETDLTKLYLKPAIESAYQKYQQQ